MATEKQIEQDRKNRNFTQVYPKGWQRITALARDCPAGAVGLYSFFAENLDPGCGAVLCDQAFLAQTFGVTTRTIRTWLRNLEEHGAVVSIPVVGKVCAYALSPSEVWKGFDNGKDYAAFITKTLINKDQAIQRRLKIFMAETASQQELFQ